MLIYCADAYIEGEHYRQYFTTLKEARGYERSTDAQPVDRKITRLRVPASRRGIVKALNDVLSFYCVNEK
jgi:hypothetical protein